MNIESAIIHAALPRITSGPLGPRKDIYAISTPTAERAMRAAAAIIYGDAAPKDFASREFFPAIDRMAADGLLYETSPDLGVSYYLLTDKGKDTARGMGLRVVD
jgi:hypothetical protein